MGLEQEAAEPLISKMCDSMRHRGPDGGAVFVDKRIALGHRRLSIIDLTDAASQPFTDDINRYVIVFNGEIYNYQALRAQLSYDWKTNSDTEVLIAAYSEWGKDCLQHLSGMFAFAIYDQDTEELFMARDRLGVKPLYVYHNFTTLVFASEIRTLLKSGLVKAELDPLALKDYLRYGYVRTDSTILKDIKQIKPGEYALYKQGVFLKGYYWSLIQSDLERAKGSHESVVAQTASLLENSVKDRMVADVKVGAFLSGGIDSSAVVALMAGMSPTPVETYSIVFGEKEFDESEYSGMIARKYKTKHTELLLRPEALLEQLPAFFRAMDHPTPDGINTFVVSGLVAKTGIRVVLSGSGGDELFAGYPGFRHWKRFARYAWMLRLPLLPEILAFAAGIRGGRGAAKIRELIGMKSRKLSDFYAQSRSVCSLKRISSLAHVPEKETEAWTNLDHNFLKSYPKFSQYTVAELSHYTLDVLLKDTDQMSMAHALEVREPFFDYRLINFLLGVDDRHKLKGHTPKSLLVEAMGSKLPPELVHRPKKGFTFPWKLWLKNELRTYCEEALTALGKRSEFKADGIQALWTDFLNDAPDSNWLQVWQLVVLEHWLRTVMPE